MANTKNDYNINDKIYIEDSYIRDLIDVKSLKDYREDEKLKGNVIDYNNFMDHYNKVAIPKLCEANSNQEKNNESFETNEIFEKANKAWESITSFFDSIPENLKPKGLGKIQQWVDIGVNIYTLKDDVINDVYKNGETPLQASVSRGLAVIGSTVAGVTAGAALVASAAVDPTIPYAYQEEVGRRTNELYDAIDNAIDSYFENGAEYAKSLCILWQHYSEKTLDSVLSTFENKNSDSNTFDNGSISTAASMCFGGTGFLYNNKDQFNAAQSVARRRPNRDPLAIDLDGDGLETVSTEKGTHFDLDGNGYAEKTGWVKGDDALFARDINGDGKINNGG